MRAGAGADGQAGSFIPSPTLRAWRSVPGLLRAPAGSANQAWGSHTSGGAERTAASLPGTGPPDPPCLAGEAAAVTRELPSPRGLWAGQWGQLCPQTRRPQDSGCPASGGGLGRTLLTGEAGGSGSPPNRKPQGWVLFPPWGMGSSPLPCTPPSKGMKPACSACTSGSPGSTPWGQPCTLAPPPPWPVSPRHTPDHRPDHHPDTEVSVPSTTHCVHGP